MAANLLLFDDLGKIWDGGSPQLRASFGAPQSHVEFSTYVVKNMGFVAVNLYGRSCEIRLRPRLVTPHSFASLRQWLQGRDFERVVTAHFDTDWVYGLHANLRVAVDKLDKVLSKANAPRPGDFLMRQLPKDELPRTTTMHRALHSLIENWPMLSQSVHRDGLSNIIKQSLQGRYHMMHEAPGSQQLTFGEIGTGFVSYSEEWRMQSIGKSIIEHEDSSYGKWVASHCHAAVTAAQPMICDVDAIMTTPRLGRARLRYKRLFLPSQGMGGGTWLLTSSILDPTIDLRVDLLDKTG